MQATLVAKLITGLVVLAFCFSVPPSRAIDVVEGLCAAPVRLERLGELAHWRSKQMYVPFAVESHDGHAWLYVPGGEGQMNIDEDEFNALVSRMVDDLGGPQPGLEILHGATTVTLISETPIHLQREPGMSGMKFTLLNGCVFSIIIMQKAPAQRSDIVRLFDLVKISQ
jgi:hypothetical protein